MLGRLNLFNRALPRPFALEMIYSGDSCARLKKILRKYAAEYFRADRSLPGETQPRHKRPKYRNLPRYSVCPPGVLHGNGRLNRYRAATRADMHFALNFSFVCARACGSVLFFHGIPRTVSGRQFARKILRKI